MFLLLFGCEKLLSWKHPLDAMEYIVTPVIFRSSRIAEELAASPKAEEYLIRGNIPAAER